MTVKEEIIKGRITSGVAEELLPLNNEDAVDLAEIITNKNFSMREVRKIVKYHLGDHQLIKASSFPYTNHEYFIYSDGERRLHRIDRTVGKCITALRISLYRISDAIKAVEDEWEVREVLAHHGNVIHDQ